MFTRWLPSSPVQLPNFGRSSYGGYNSLHTSSRPGSPEALVDLNQLEHKLGGQQQGHPGRRGAGAGAAGGPRALAATMWLFTSPVVVLGLLMALGMKRAALDDHGVLDAYTCRPPSVFSSLAGVCADGTARDGAVFEQEVRDSPAVLGR